MIRNIADDFRISLQSHRFGIICNLGKLSLGRLKLCMILDVGLHFRVLRQPLVLRGVGDHGGLGLGDMSSTIGQLVKPLVVFHGQLHVADLASEAIFVPHFFETFELLHRVDGFPALCTKFRHSHFTIRSPHSDILKQNYDTMTRLADRLASINYCQLRVGMFE